MSVNTRTQAQRTAGSPAVSVDQARAAWATASRDTELDRWNALYEAAVPQTARTTWERHQAEGAS